MFRATLAHSILISSRPDTFIPFDQNFQQIFLISFLSYDDRRRSPTRFFNFETLSKFWFTSQTHLYQSGFLFISSFQITRIVGSASISDFDFSHFTRMVNILETLTNARMKVNVKESCNFFQRKMLPPPPQKKENEILNWNKSLKWVNSGSPYSFSLDLVDESSDFGWRKVGERTTVRCSTRRVNDDAARATRSISFNVGAFVAGSGQRTSRPNFTTARLTRFYSLVLHLRSPQIPNGLGKTVIIKFSTTSRIQCS